MYWVEAENKVSVLGKITDIQFYKSVTWACASFVMDWANEA